MRAYSIHLRIRYRDLTLPKHLHIGVKVVISTICTPSCFFVEDSCLCSRHPLYMVYCSIKHSIQRCIHQKRSPLANIDNCLRSLIFFSMATPCDKKPSLWRVTVASCAVHTWLMSAHTTLCLMPPRCIGKVWNKMNVLSHDCQTPIIIAYNNTFVKVPPA